MISSEFNMYNQLDKLKTEYNLHGIKAEFEAEGSSFRDLVRLSRVAARLDLGIFLKIGGVEAKTDIKNALELDVAGLIAPMVESKFGLKKFIDITSGVYPKQEIHKAFNVETKGAIDNLEEILDFAVGKINCVTVGRSDLSKSYFNQNITPDSPFIFDLLLKIGRSCKARGLKMNVGGSISANTINLLRGNKELCELIDLVETRKVILPIESWFKNNNVIDEVLHFEKLYIESINDLNTHFITADLQRLGQLNARVA